MSIETVDAQLRCAEHPGRPAHDRCPRCHRPRCEADIAAYGASGCPTCTMASDARPPGLLEVAIRAGLATWPIVMIGGWITTQYVYDHIFSLVVPGLIGFAAALVARAVAGRRDRQAAVVVIGIAAVAGVLGTALGFHLLPGGRQSVLTPFSVVGAPYLCSVLGAVLFPIVFADPRSRRG